MAMMALMMAQASYPARGTWIEMVITGDNVGDIIVVPRTGYVDRNDFSGLLKGLAEVVPRTGYVDRNVEEVTALAAAKTSYPARGTWIEMFSSRKVRWVTRSYPARGTWIEMLCSSSNILPAGVVPRTGYVDRNVFIQFYLCKGYGRTPHGVRG